MPTSALRYCSDKAQYSGLEFSFNHSCSQIILTSSTVLCVLLCNNMHKYVKVCLKSMFQNTLKYTY